MFKALKKGLIFGLVLLMSLSFVGCSKKLTAGEHDGHTYTNDYFGLELTYPETWTVHTEEEIEEMTEAGNEMVLSENEEMDLALKISELKTVYLTYGSTVDTLGDASFMAFSENLLATGVKTEDGYLSAVKDGLEMMKDAIPFDLTKPVYSETIDGKTFRVLEVSVDTGMGVLTQKYYAHIINKHALGFIVTYSSEDIATEMNTFLQSITIQ